MEPTAQATSEPPEAVFRRLFVADHGYVFHSLRRLGVPEWDLAETVPVPETVPESVTAPRPDQPAKAPMPRDASLREERRLLELARTAFERGRAAEAEAALRAHATRFARGQLTEERESLRVPVLVALGKHAEARRAGERFLARYPRSPLRSLVEHSLSSIP